MWSRREWVYAALCACGAFAVTAAVLWPVVAIAEGEASPAAAIATPQLKLGNCVVTAHMIEGDQVIEVKEGGNVVLKPGLLPKLALEANNPGTAAATLQVEAALRVSTLKDMMSRVLVLPKEAWKQTYTITLQPGASQRVEMVTDVKLEAGSTARLTLRAPTTAAAGAPEALLPQGITVLMLNTPAPTTAAQPAP